MYADQTWMAGIGPVSDRDLRLWQIVREARDQALGLLEQRIRNGRTITGAEVDWAARAVIKKAGLESAMSSRTGHSIDRFGLHGFGPPIDGTETRDARKLIPGIGFSVEPGVYLKGETGVRSEVSVYLTKEYAVVTPRHPQNELIVL
jgi:Xaa-Pro aminopeptidase